MGVHHDGDPALGVRRQDLGAEGLLGHVLQGLVDGELDAGAGNGGRAVGRLARQRHPVGRRPPRGPMPFWPARSELYWYSRPDCPASAAPTVPMSGAASDPAGSMRSVSGAR